MYLKKYFEINGPLALEFEPHRPNWAFGKMPIKQLIK
jgi:hypothetical protein